MDTKPSDIDRLSGSEISDLISALKVNRHELDEQLFTLMEGMVADFRAIRVTLPVPASKEMCLDAARCLRIAFDDTTDSYRPKAESIKKQLEHIIEICFPIPERLHVLAEEEEDNMHNMHSLIDRQNLFCCEIEQNLALFFEVQTSQTSILLQNRLQELVKRQDEELRNWFMNGELEQAGSHLKVAKSARPDVAMDISVSRNPTPSSSLKLPFEIMVSIYELSNLETCVALREASKDWYVAFRNSERVMERKVQERNPWIKPGDTDLPTWADCVLVFAGRLRSEKWETIGNPGNVFHIPVEPVEVKAVVGVELQLNEKLPANFTNMFEEPDKVKVPNTYDTMDMSFKTNPWALSRSKPLIIPKELVRENEEGLVIRYDGIEVTLDPSITYGDISRVCRQPTTIQVTLKDYTIIVFPVDRPHYKHSVRIEDTSDSDVETLDLEDAVFHREGESNHDSRFSLVNFAKKEVIFFCKYANPVAAYNGLIWLHMGEHLLPTFVDLQTPGVVYYRAKRAIRGFDQDSLFLQASKARGLGQFVILLGRHNMPLVDLATGSLTQIQAPEGWLDYRIILGFQDGVFKVRCIKSSVMEAVARRALREYGVAT